LFDVRYEWKKKLKSVLHPDSHDMSRGEIVIDGENTNDVRSAKSGELLKFDVKISP
jgi:hypothetical protein